MTDVRHVAAATILCALVLTPGCVSKEVETWTPRPPVHWDDIATEPVPFVENGYRIIQPDPTKGLFPAAIGVTRVAAVLPQDEASTRRLRLVRDPRNEFLMWNSSFDDQMAISEVFPLALRDLGGAEVNASQIIAANRALKAQVALLYAVNELSETQTEMLGTLYDTQTVQPVAAFHAQAESIPPREESEDPNDLWETDSKALVRAKFEHFVYACVRELILRDEPSAVEAPTGWTPAGPIMPVEWPPRQFRTGP